MRTRPAAWRLSALKLQPLTVITALALAPLPFACSGTTETTPDVVADDAGDAANDVTSQPHEAGLSDVVHSLDTGTDTGPSGPASHPPGPTGPATVVTTEHDFAISKLYLGDSPRGGGAQSTTAWKDFGYDLDGKVSTAASADVCTLTAGASKSVQADGALGIDNSFGANVVPFFFAITSSFGTDINASITSGNATLLIDTVGLSDDAMQTNTGLTAQLFGGGNFGGAPTFTTSDVWPVTASSLTDGSTVAGGAKTKFLSAYVAGGTWVSGSGGGSAGDVPITLVTSGITLSLIVHHATISFNHSAATKATNGTIAGVLDTEEFVTMFRAIAGQLSTSLCTASTLDSISNQLRQASDMIKDGTNTAGTACNGISIGLGFDADQIAPPSTVAPTPAPVPNPCL